MNFEHRTCVYLLTLIFNVSKQHPCWGHLAPLSKQTCRFLTLSYELVSRVTFELSSLFGVCISRFVYAAISIGLALAYWIPVHYNNLTCFNTKSHSTMFHRHRHMLLHIVTSSFSPLGIISNSHTCGDSNKTQSVHLRCLHITCTLGRLMMSDFDGLNTQRPPLTQCVTQITPHQKTQTYVTIHSKNMKTVTPSCFKVFSCWILILYGASLNQVF